jgi:rRNA-processing protein FCF1
VFITSDDMNLVMDSDCLIKLTKAGLKEAVCEAWKVHIPPLVYRETTREAPRLPDAERIKENVASGQLHLGEGPAGSGKGEEAALRLYQSGDFYAIATDDARFIRRLRGLGIPFAVPSVLIVRMHLDGRTTKQGALESLDALAPMISAEERSAAELMLTGGLGK